MTTSRKPGSGVRPLLHLIYAAAGLVLALGCASITRAVDQPANSGTPSAEEPLRVALGGRLFGDFRLSRDNTRSCSSCHDLRANGATRNVQDTALDGSPL